MITTSKPVPTMTQGASREGYFGVKSKNAAHLFGILRGQLYSDKPMAILREYCTNAQDSHAESGCPDRPIEVKMPSLLDMTLTIRDYGTGLSEDDIFEVFASYGESTKRNTNHQVGMLGLGSKSAFSYVNSFTIISRFGGERSMYEAYLDETGLGKISLMHRAPTEEENGLEIQVAVGSRDDIQKFGDAAVRLFAHWSPRPVIMGSPLVLQGLEEFDRGFKKNTVEKGSNWTLFHQNVPFYGYGSPFYGSRSMHAVSCVMGNVLYPVDANQLSQQNQAWLRNLHALRFQVPIGDVEPVASREGLEYSRYTIVSLDRHLDAIRKEIAGKLESNLQAANSLWEARCELNSMRRLVYNIGCDFTWRGHPLAVDPVKIPQSVIKVRRYDRATQKWNITRDRNVFPNRDVVIFVDRGDVPKNSRFDRIRQNYNLLNVHMVCIEFPDAQSAKDWSKKSDVVGAPIVYLSELPYKRKSSPRRATAGVDAKRLGEAFVYKGARYATVKSTAWDVVEVDMEKGQGVYVALSGFLPKDLTVPDHATLDALNDICNSMKGLKSLPDKVYGFRKSSVDKLGPGWKPLATYVMECFSKNMDDPDILSGLHHNFVESKISREIIKLAESRDKLPEGPMRELLCRIASLKPCENKETVWSFHRLSTLVQGVQQTYDQKFDMLCGKETNALYAKVQETYPMIFLLKSYWHDKGEHLNYVLDYIRLVDGQA